MGYRIVYGPMPPVPKVKSPRTTRLRILTAVFLLLFVFLVRQAWPEGTQTLRRFLLPRERTVTEEAFSGMIEEIRDGEPLGDAFTAFCRQIIDYGYKAAY